MLLPRGQIIWYDFQPWIIGLKDLLKLHWLIRPPSRTRCMQHEKGELARPFCRYKVIIEKAYCSIAKCIALILVFANSSKLLLNERITRTFDHCNSGQTNEAATS